MWKAVLKGGIVGGIILYIWLGLSWMVFPWHCRELKGFTDEQKVATVLQENTDANGLYLLPYMCGEKGREGPVRKEGMLVFASIVRENHSFESKSPYIISFFTQMIAAALATALLFHLKDKPYGCKVGHFTLFGILVGLLVALPNWTWWGYSLAFSAFAFIDLVIGWFLAGLVISRFLKSNANHTT